MVIPLGAEKPEPSTTAPRQIQPALTNSLLPPPQPPHHFEGEISESRARSAEEEAKPQIGEAKDESTGAPVNPIERRRMLAGDAGI